MDDLLNALDNESNKHIMNLSYAIIKKEKNDILQQIQLKGDSLKIYHKKLENYRYISDISQLNNGNYIRWINLKKIYEKMDNNNLTNGAIICDWKIFETGVHIICKTNFNKIFQIKFDENLIFQKLTDQENILLSVMNYINK
jgi:hypothetical protein